MVDKYYINDVYNSNIVINKSKFISYAHKVETIDEVNDLLKKYKKQYYDSTHVCYAYVLDIGKEKAYDDGEPSKTAGAPILEVIKKKNMSNIIIFVIRYFGGILLGAGGLVRAYTESAVKALDNATLYKKNKALAFDLVLNYKEFDTLKKINNIQIINVIYDLDVKIKCITNISSKEEIEKILLSNNIISSISNIEKTYIYEKIN